MVKGAFWVYHEVIATGEVEDTVTVTDVRPIGQDVEVTLRHRYKSLTGIPVDSSKDTSYTVRPDGSMVTSDFSETTDSTATEYGFPLHAITWPAPDAQDPIKNRLEGTSQGSAVVAVVTLTPSAVQSVTVQAGSFQARVVIEATTLEVTGNELKTSVTQFFAENVGLVKWEFDGFGLKYSAELVSYQIPGM